MPPLVFIVNYWASLLSKVTALLFLFLNFNSFHVWVLFLLTTNESVCLTSQTIILSKSSFLFFQSTQPLPTWTVQVNCSTQKNPLASLLVTTIKDLKIKLQSLAYTRNTLSFIKCFTHSAHKLRAKDLR